MRTFTFKSITSRATKFSLLMVCLCLGINAQAQTTFTPIELNQEYQSNTSYYYSFTAPQDGLLIISYTGQAPDFYADEAMTEWINLD